MNKVEATEILDRQILELKTLPYATFYQWQQRKHFKVCDIKSETGKYYKIEIQALLEDSNKANNNIRVIASIDDSHLVSLSALVPLKKSFVISPSSTIVEE